MRIIIPVTTEYAEDFIQWLVERIKGMIFLSLNMKKLKSFEMYQKDEEIFKPHTKESGNLNFKKAILKGIKSINYTRIKDNWIISIPQNKPYPGYYATIYSICKFVNNGNMDIQGYNLFSKVFIRVKTNLTKYYNQFLREYVL